jgi:hypothetical protein
MKELIFRADDLAVSKRRAFVELVYQARFWILYECVCLCYAPCFFLSDRPLTHIYTYTHGPQMDAEEEIEGFAPGATLSFKRTISPTGTLYVICMCVCMVRIDPEVDRAPVYPPDRLNQYPTHTIISPQPPQAWARTASTNGR